MSFEFSLFLCSFFLLLLIGVPISFTMGMASVLYLLFSDMGNMSMVFNRVANSLQSYLYTAVPFFILAGLLMNNAGITQRIFDFTDSFVGHIRGGLAQVNVVGSVIFAGMTGTAIGDAAGLGRVEIHAMTKAGYKPAFAAAVTISSAVLGPIIPPSMAMIIYAELAEVSVADLFLGGCIPGLIIAAALMGYIYIVADRVGPKPLPRRSWPERGRATKRALLPILSPVLVVGGIVSGAITPTEAAVLAVLYAMLLMVLYRETDLRSVALVFRDSALGTAGPLFIVTTALLFSWIVTVEQIPERFVGLLGPVTESWWLSVLVINVILLFLGMMLEGIGIMILTIPVLKALALAAGIDLVHLGVFMTVNLMLGMLTPPVGLGLFVACDITGCSFSEIVRATTPFLIPLVAGLILISFVPQTVLWLPNLVLH